jgi:hypothetical protein
VSDRTCGLCQQPITEGQSRVMEYRDGHVITAHRTCAGRAYPAPTGPLIAPAPVSEEEGSEGRLTALATTWAARITSESERVSSVAECVCRHGYFWGECYECCRVALIGAFKEAAAPAPPPSTGDEAPVRCAHGVAICMECAADDYASPRAQTGTPDEGVSEEQLANLERLIAGAWAAPWVAHTFEIDCPCPNGDDCGDTHTCEQVEAPEAYPASPEDPAPAGEGQCVVQISVPGLESLARPNAEFIVAARNALPALIAEVRRLRSAALRREERDPRLAALEEAARVVDGLAAHTSREDEEQRAWLYAYAKAAAAIRALSSPATNPEPETKETHNG